MYTYIYTKNAPYFGFGDLSKNTNGRFPGYSQKKEFCKRVGFLDLFFNNTNGLLKDYPGCVALEQQHLRGIQVAMRSWEKGHPLCKQQLPYKEKEPAGFAQFTAKQKEAWSREQNFDWYYARLIWFEFWMKWALTNCKEPVVSCE